MSDKKIEFEISAKLDNIDKQFSSLNRMAQDSAKKVESAFSGIGSSLKTALAGAVSIGALGVMVKSVADAGDQLGKLSTRTGVAVEELSKLQYAASLSDVSNEDLANSLGRLNRVLGEAADGSKEATAALARFGIAPGTLNASEAFTVIAERVKNTGDQTKIASAMNDIFGRSWQTLVPMIKGGAEGLKQAGDELERMGGVMSGDLAKASEAFNDNITRLNTQLDALKLQMVGPLIPLLQELTGEFAASSEKATDLAKSGSALKTAFEAVSVFGANVSYVLKQTGNEIGGLAAQLASLGRGDFKGAMSIGSMMKEDAKQARAEFDALEYRLMNSQILNESRKLKDSWMPPTSPAPSSSQGITGTPKTPKSPKSTKTDDPFADFLKDLESRIKPAEQALDSFRQMQLDAAVSGADLTAAEKKFYDLINSPEWQTMGEPWKELVTQQFEAANATQKAADEQQRLNELLAETPTTKIETLTADLDLLTRKLNEGRISQQRYEEAVYARVGATADKMKETTDLMEEFSKQAARNMQDALAEFLFDPFENGVDGMLKSFGTMLQKMVAQAVAADLAKRMFGEYGGGEKGSTGWLGALAKLFQMNANGGVYASPGLSAYSGQIVSKPTVFPFAAGIGLMGEAGPEAIMPLSRTSDGKLGVKAQGAGNVSITINNSMSDQAHVTAQPRMNNGQLEIEVLVQRALANDMSRNGPITQGLSNTFGLRRGV